MEPSTNLNASWPGSLKKGMIVYRDNEAYRIVKIWPSYTMDVADEKGRHYRWTGLSGCSAVPRS